MELELNETTDAATWRAYVSVCRDEGIKLDPHVEFAVTVADLFEVPDDMSLLPAVCAAMATPTRLDDPASMAHTKAIAHAAGHSRLLPGGEA
jgi:hypothetical protein